VTLESVASFDARSDTIRRSPLIRSELKQTSRWIPYRFTIDIFFTVRLFHSNACVCCARTATLMTRPLLRISSIDDGLYSTS